jgi:hypothetical protein
MLDIRFIAFSPEIEHKLDLLLERTGKIMATLDEILAKVEEEGTLDDSIIALLNGLKTQLADVLSGVVIPPAVQAKLDAVWTKATDNVAKVSAAITENTPAAPTP